MSAESLPTYGHEAESDSDFKLILKFVRDRFNEATTLHTGDERYRHYLLGANLNDGALKHTLARYLIVSDYRERMIGEGEALEIVLPVDEAGTADVAAFRNTEHDYFHVKRYRSGDTQEALVTAETFTELDQQPDGPVTNLMYKLLTYEEVPADRRIT